MWNKLLILIIIYKLFCGINQSQAEEVECNYGDGLVTVITSVPTNISDYECQLENHFENSTVVNKQHLSGKNDKSVLMLRCESRDVITDFSAIYCQKFRYLETIYTKNALIKSMDEDSLFLCRDLLYLSLEENKFHELPENLMSRNSRLKFVRFKDSLLETLPEKFFTHQRNLEELDLRNNQIYNLPSLLFRPLVELINLFLNGNKLVEIDEKWFESLEYLKRLEIKRNKIREIPPGIFRSLKSLDFLSLEDNKIKSLDPKSFYGLENINSLSVATNLLSDLPPNIFKPLTKIRWLVLYNNQLKTLHSDSFNIPNDLDGLWLFDNKMISIDPKIIVNNKFGTLDFNNNICANFVTWTASEVNAKLEECFKNYQARSQNLLIQQEIFNFSESKLEERSCGKSFAAQGNIIGGTYIKRGAFPWIGVLVKPKGDFICGCTLVSNRKAITAAHCIQQKGSASATLAREILVLLGIHDLKNKVETGRAAYAVQQIQMHDDWNPSTQSFDADIAVLVLESSVNFNKNIQPICLIPPGSDFLSITQGIVVGFGQSEDLSKIHENVAKTLDLPIHTFQKCFKDFPVLGKLASGRTFCAGSGTGIGVCRGDSGSGVFVNQDGTYFLRGIVSSSLIGGPFGCDVDTYAIFTDVTKYYDWINKVPVDQNAAIGDF